MMRTAEQEEAQAKRNVDEAQREIIAALKKAWPEFYEPPPNLAVGSRHCNKLSHLQIGMGVRALVLACNLQGGSTGDLDIYRLMQTYLKDPEARAKINVLVGTTRVNL